MDEVFAVRVAIDEGDMDKACGLVARLSSPNAQGDHGRSALHFAAWHRGAASVVAKLIELGCDVNIRSEFDGTPLFGAARRNTPDVVRQLLDAGADVGIRDAEGCTALAISTTRLS